MKQWFGVLVAVAGLAQGSLAQEQGLTSAQKAEGWKSLFDGTSLNGWEVKSGFAEYRVEEGAIVGKTAAGSPNTFLCTKERFADFELVLETKLDNNGLNSGVQVRSTINAGTDAKYGGRVGGPQVEFEKSPGQSGFVYGETLKGWLSPEPDSSDKSVSSNTLVKNGEWNQYRILVEGARIQTWINGQPVADLTLDESLAATYAEGLIGLQVHGVKKDQGPYQVRWRNIKIRPIAK